MNIALYDRSKSTKLFGGKGLYTLLRQLRTIDFSADKYKIGFIGKAMKN